MTQTVRLVLADDQVLVREGFRLILEAEDDLEVVGEASDGRDCIEIVKRTLPHVVLMDVRMPVMDGIEATRRIVAGGIDSRILILTTFDLDEYVYDAIQAGASGFLLKNVGARQLVDGVRAVADGDALLAPPITKRLLEHFLAASPSAGAEAAEAVARLSERERELLRLLASGMSNSELAAHLYLSEPTVKTHLTSIFRKLGVRDRVQAVIAAYDARLVHPAPRTATRPN